MSIFGDVLGVGGIATSIIGAMDASGAAQSASNDQKQIVQLQQQADQQRQQQMTLMGRRSQTEAIRNSQRARSLALNNAAGEGAQYGSGLQGGYGNIAGQTNTNMLGINQNLQIGQNMFGITSQENTAKINLASDQSAQQQGSALASLGGDITKAANPLAGIMSSLPGLLAL